MDNRSSISPTDAVAAALEKISALDGGIKAFVELDAAGVREAAARLEAETGADGKPLYGMPIAIKEIVDVAGALCQWGAKAQKGRRAVEDAEAVSRLRAAGAMILGTVVSTEYAIADAGPTRNPHDLERTPGGSSSGPAAAVAAGMAKAAIGTQTVGSIVRPAIYCGIPGFKPTYGRLPLAGVMPLSVPLDHLGIFADSWETVSRVFGVLSDIGNDNPEPLKRCVKMEPPAEVEIKSASARAMKLASMRIAELGIHTVRLPALEELRLLADDIAYEFVAIGMATHHGGDYDRAPDDLSATARRLVERGRAYSDADTARLMDRLDALRTDIDGVLQPGDFILGDAVEDIAPKWAADQTGPNRLQGVWSVLGLPTAAWTTDHNDETGMPIGVQVSSPRGTDTELLSLMSVLDDTHA